MLYRITAHYEFERDMQKRYDSLIEDNFLPDEAKLQIEDDLREEIERIHNRAEKVFCWPYDEGYEVEELGD